MKAPLRVALLSVLLVDLLLIAGCSNPFGSSASTAGPGSLRATSEIGRSTLTWKPVLGAQNYSLEWSTDPSFAVGTVTSVTSKRTSFEHNLLSPGTHYYYRVRANLNSGPTAWSQTQWYTAGWTWVGPLTSTQTFTYTDTRTESFGGSTVQLVTEYSKKVEGLQSLRYDKDGVVWSTWLRTSTAISGASGAPAEESAAPQTRVGSWTVLWSKFQIDGEFYDVTTSPDRKTLVMTADSSSWRLRP